MKRLAVLMIGLMLISACAASALAYSYDETGNPLWCMPEEVDLSKVREENGRLIGEIGIPQKDGDEHVLKIDCPIPALFSREQQAKLSVTYREISKKQLMEAMEALKQKENADRFSEYKSGWESRWIGYSVNGKDGDGFSYPWLMPGYQTKDAAFAVEKLRELAQQLAIPLALSTSVVARNTADDWLAYSSATQNSSTWYQEIAQAYANLPGDAILITAGYQLYGLPVQRQFRWKVGESWYGEASQLQCAVGENGTFWEVQITNVPEVESREAITLPRRSWQEVLKLCVAQSYWPNTVARDIQVENDSLFGDYTVYAAYDVITSIEPCWLGREKQCLEPAWAVRGLSKVLKDDSICSWFERAVPALP